MKKSYAKFFTCLIFLIIHSSFLHADDLVGLSKGNKETVVSRFGSCTSFYIDGTEEGEEVFHYKYGNDYFAMTGDGHIVELFLTTSRFSVYDWFVEGGFKVGDKYDIIKTRAKVQFMEIMDYNAGKGWKDRVAVVTGDGKGKYTDYPIVLKVVNGIIKTICYQEYD